MSRILIYVATGTPVRRSDRVLTAQGDRVTVVDMIEPRAEGQTGRVYIRFSTSRLAACPPVDIGAAWTSEFRMGAGVSQGHGRQ